MPFVIAGVPLMHFFVKHRRQSPYTSSLLRFFGVRPPSELGFSPVSEPQEEEARPRTIRRAGFFRKSGLTEIFALDVRSLALFRASLALVILADLLSRSV